MLKSCFQTELAEAGCDEAGRGCFAGPVFAAAVIFPPGFTHAELNDSKLLSEEKRLKLRVMIEQEAVAYAVASVAVSVIDRINILKASFRAMHLALQQLNPAPGFLLIDGNRFARYKKIPFQCIVKGDSTYASIAAAGILAKTYRDEYMIQLHDAFPQYNWNSNKGYGTPEHRAAIAQYGLSPHHRKSFRLLSSQADLF